VYGFVADCDEYGEPYWEYRLLIEVDEYGDPYRP
jgi:hypothetical protein